VFLWGATVAFTALGHDPFGRAEPKEMARRVLFEEPDLEYLPPGLKKLVEAAVAKDPEDRPEAAELLRGLLDLDGAATVRELMERSWTEVAVRPPEAPRQGLRLFGQSRP
jgi:hypothetical protein